MSADQAEFKPVGTPLAFQDTVIGFPPALKVTHIVMWTLKQSIDAPRFKELLESCGAVVPGILAFQVGVKSPTLEGNVDVVLYSVFSDRTALDAYQGHPHHKAISAQLQPLRDTRSVLDFES
jgi:quinol monooxygenase YgiN